ncbi:exopolysaccharide biosynthesis polyprenyl glycosylphosphotransferase [Piscinibacter koreensis]|uniref:Exopolysaccharide biosynthesis polyprenyl glycosylphosphotransferase n=1 Tax=Piscinibacter koreensis TaxID=2742824 RepID=A0A7Y6NRB6_9BURK|nr:exopolysaccharide biosynthesis polyprenyl glycosylphosphotransferase [Schlegelella koreensis]NUZ07888.1 exopolysaccharide biosynthesis polyprenyl glycosylphosphotransferase [Schlegelella koreensis]
MPRGPLRSTRVGGCDARALVVGPRCRDLDQFIRFERLARGSLQERDQPVSAREGARDEHATCEHRDKPTERRARLPRQQVQAEAEREPVLARNAGTLLVEHAKLLEHGRSGVGHGGSRRRWRPAGKAGARERSTAAGSSAALMAGFVKRGWPRVKKSEGRAAARHAPPQSRRPERHASTAADEGCGGRAGASMPSSGGPSARQARASRAFTGASSRSPGVACQPNVVKALRHPSRNANMVRPIDRHRCTPSLRHAGVDGGMTATGSLLIATLPAHAVALPAALSLALAFAGCVLLGTVACGVYNVTLRGSATLAWAQVGLALALAFLLADTVLALHPAARGRRSDRGWLFISLIAVVIGHRVWATHGRRAAARRRHRLIIFGSGSSARGLGESLRAADRGVEVVGYLAGPNEPTHAVDAEQLLGGARSLREVVAAHRADEVVVAITERRGGSMPLRELLECKAGGVRVSDLSTCYETMLGQIAVEQAHPGWLAFGDGFEQGAWRSAVKRVFDIGGALLLLAMALPLMALTALAIALESRGPVLYRQERVGRGGKPFRVLKFRSMRADAEQDGVPKWAAAQDVRVTRVGHFIRRFRIDEIPQFLNVLTGDMSLVGPRPERPYFVEQLTRRWPSAVAGREGRFLDAVCPRRAEVVCVHVPVETDCSPSDLKVGTPAVDKS